MTSNNGCSRSRTCGWWSSSATKKRYSDRECEAIYQELAEAGLDDEAMRDADAIEAVFKKLNAAERLKR
jgi:hypothetical protein